MGLPLSIPTKDILSINSVVDRVYDQIVELSEQKQMDLATVQLAILSVLNTVNSCMPGLQYDPPSLEEVQNFHKTWNKKSDQEEKKKELKNFIEDLLRKGKKSNMNTMITGIVAPPVAMITKRVGEQVPPLKKTLKFVPDAAFVPAFTIGALFTVKMVQKNVLEKIRKPI
ncbi:uncharacterized protein LOC116266201 [Nymphaea colorata]|nr:uncharacterized protein LOC116266201 [Nymphaea colorata]